MSFAIKFSRNKLLPRLCTSTTRLKSQIAKDTGYNRVLTIPNLNKRILNARYDVRGEIYLAAVKRTQEGKEVIYTNIGNPHSLGQKPVTFSRQVLALVMAPFLLDHPQVNSMFPPDAIARARQYLANINGGIGAYSDSKGVPFIRREIASFITKISGQPSDPENIFISNGASEVARMLLQALLKNTNDGIMVPIPQYPLYSASITLYGGQLVPYFLNEEDGWSLGRAELERALMEAKKQGTTVKGLVFINPGNPTGQCLTEKNLRDLMEFCHANSIVLMADEVYQKNIYATDRPFIPARKVLGEMAPEIAKSLELVSMHSTSKGVVGECGLRGGYAECHNIDPAVVEELYKLSAINLCSNLPGQIAMGLMLSPPQPGDPSYQVYKTEVDGLLDSLRRRAKLITKAFNSLPGFSCQATDGAMYAFPQITLPPKFISHAESLGKPADVLYCLQLLDQTGLCCVPGTGFRQRPGTYHFRTTILPQEEHFDSIISKFSAFQESLLKKYA